MPGGISIGFNLITITLFILPGIAGVKYGLLIADRADWLNRTDTIALSFGLSLLSATIAYFLYSGISTEILTYTDLLPILDTPLNTLSVYFHLMIISLLIGNVLGMFEFGGETIASRQGLWYEFFSRIESESESEKYQVRVRMQSGDELWGRVEDKGEISLDRDILLEEPRRIIREENGTISEDYNYTGYAYLHNQGISHVEFDSISDADRAEAIKQQNDNADSQSTEEDDQEMEELKSIATSAESSEEKEDNNSD
ncbi:hypothetical protein [Natrinema pallidum]|uniref:Uncharacterized protein n=1 Tax=Natrinema pallidum TaxID=69527 RepID=A0A4P9TEI6_9EURY|nr:hypothetical protein [Natrinema pallidum]QCW03047.1 hypothetical protein FGF80_07265 [Natrinema pallidum]